MPISFKTSTFGFYNVKKAINDAFESSINEAGRQVEQYAKSLCDVPTVENSIQLNQVDKGFEITTGNGMAQPELTAYYEFGTGNAAAVLVPNLPQDWQDMARKYFVNGQGKLPAHPYLYPAFQRMVANIENVIISKI